MSVRINIGVAYNGRNIKRSWGDLRKLAAVANTTSDRVKVLGAQMQLIGRVGTSVGRTLTRQVSMPLAAIGGYAVKTAADFETSFAKIEGLVGVSADEIAALEEAAARLGPQFGKSSTEAAEALFFITSAGLRGQEAIDTLEASLKASAIGLGETAVVADLVTSATNAYGSSVLSASRATDTLTAAVRYGKLEPADLAQSMGMVLPVASAMGVSFDQVGAAFAAMSRTGTDASTAATQLRQILATILKPTAEANDELAKYGLSAQGLREQLRKRGLLSVLQTLTGTLGMNDDAISKVFGNIRALSGVLDLMGSNAQATEEIFAGMVDTTGMLDDAFGVTADTAAFQFQQALAELKDVMREIGQDLLPIVMDMVEGIRDLVQRFKDLSPEQQDIAVKFAAIAAVAGPLIVVLGNLVTIIGGVTAALGGMSIAMAVATGGLSLLAAAIGYAVFQSATMSDEQRDAQDAAVRNANEQLKLAGAYGEAAQAAMEAKVAQRQAADAARYSALASAYAAGELDHLEDAGRSNVTSAVRMGAEMERATVAVGEFDAAVGGEGAPGSGGATEQVVLLSEEMRDALRDINMLGNSMGDGGQLVAQFARELLAAGSITNDTSAAAVRLAQVVKQDVDRALADANRRLDDATQKFGAYRDAVAEGIAQGNGLSDAANNQSQALERLVAAEEAYEQALASGDPDRIGQAAAELDDAQQAQGSFLDFLQTGLTTAEGFAAQIDALRLAGASMAVVQQIAELGARTGGRIAAELLAGGAAAIEQANRLVEATDAAARRAGEAAAQQFYGAGVESARQFVAAVEANIPALQGVLDRIADMIEAALGARPDVRIDGQQGPFIPPQTGEVVIEPTNGGGGRVPPPEPAEQGRLLVPGTFLAEGGLVTGPTFGVVGEAGPELVIPLDRLGAMGGGRTVVNVTVTSADPQAVVEAIRRYTRNNGPLGGVVTL